MMDSFHSILEAVARNPEQRFSELPLLSQKERQKVLVEWNATQSEYPREKCIHQLVEVRAGCGSPNAVAVMQDKNKLTYERTEPPRQPTGALSAQARSRAGRAGRRLPGEFARVARGIAGGAEGRRRVPAARSGVSRRSGLQLMLEDSHAPVLLSREGLLPELASPHTERICLLSMLESFWRARAARILSRARTPGKPGLRDLYLGIDRQAARA